MRFGLGFRTLFGKEVRRFLRVPGQTLLSPLITTVLYFAVFGVSLGSRMGEVHGVSYARFIVPGLIMLGVVSNSFLNTSSSLFVSKLQGTVVDLLVAPLSYGEILTSYVLAAIVRAFVVGIATWAVAGVFTSFAVTYPLWVFAFMLLVATFFGTLGVLVGIWAEKFEQVNIVPTFLITPLTFLGGVFYSVDRLPESVQKVALANPVLYMVDGLRYGLLGQSDVSPWTGLVLLLGLNVAAVSVAFRWLKTGYKLRS